MCSEPEQISWPGRLIRLLSGLASLRHDPGSVAYTLPLARSLVTDRSALDDGVPWLTFKATAWLDSYLEPEMHVFEFGSGGSTIFLASHVRELVSVEHDPDWYASTERALKQRGLVNCRYILRQPLSEPSAAFASTDPAFSDMSFENYVKSIDNYPDGTFDLVLVDGRARTACTIRALPKVKTGGHLLLDDADRREYRDAVATLGGYSRLDFRGAVPYRSTVGTTSVWRIDRS
jgi:hypothetical protein